MGSIRHFIRNITGAMRRGIATFPEWTPLFFYPVTFASESTEYRINGIYPKTVCRYFGESKRNEYTQLIVWEGSVSDVFPNHGTPHRKRRFHVAAHPRPPDPTSVGRCLMNDFSSRQAMVRDQLRRRGVTDEAVLAAMETVPRENFVPEEMRDFAYRDSPLPIGHGQTISQPYIVARMMERLEVASDDRVLEIGTGSGYGAAVLSRIADTVYSLERHSTLAESAREKLAALGYDNVQVIVTDGSLGWPEGAPYDGIVGTAGAPRVPEPLKEQLAEGGRLVLPVGSVPEQQILIRLRKNGENRFFEEQMEAVRFVPLVGEAGWQ